MNIERLIRHILDQADYYRLIKNYDQVDVQKYYLFIVEHSDQYINQRIPEMALKKDESYVQSVLLSMD